MRPLLLVGLAGCLTGSIKTGSTSDSTLTESTTTSTSVPVSSPPTGSTPSTETCEAEAYAAWLCAETDAPQLPLQEDEVSPPVAYSGSGTLSEVGALARLGSTLEGFRPCTVEHTHQVRLVDSDGYTWTFGWALPQEIAGESLAALSPGAAVDYLVVIDPDQVESPSTGVLLSDGAGPLFLYEERSYRDLEILTAAEQGGLSVSFDATLTCQEDYYLRHDLATLDWQGGLADLWSGDSFTIPVQPGPRDLVFFLASAYRYIEADCWIGCDRYLWYGWARP